MSQSSPDFTSDRVQHPGADSLSYWQTHNIFAVVSTHDVQTVCVLCASTRGQEVGSHSCVQQSLEVAGGQEEDFIFIFLILFQSVCRGVPL